MLITEKHSIWKFVKYFLHQIILISRTKFFLFCNHKKALMIQYERFAFR